MKVSLLWRRKYRKLSEIMANGKKLKLFMKANGSI